MTPKITYRISRNILKIRIKIYGQEEGIYDTGIYVDKKRFDAKKQISGDPVIQNYMILTADKIRKLFTPGINPKQLWNIFLNEQSKVERSHTVNNAFDYYLSTCKDCSESTVKNIKAVRTRVDMAGLGDKPITEITGAVMRTFLSSLKDYKASTIYETYMKFKTVLNRYIKENGLTFKLAIDGLCYLPPKEETEQEYLTWDEVNKLMEAEFEDKKESYFRDLFCLMCLTGMAVGDLLLFHPQDAISEDGKWFQYKRKKTGTMCTSIPLLPAARMIIERNVWPVRISVRTIQYKCDIVSELIGRTIKTHGARKTFGCIMLELGFTMEAVSKMLGHSSIAITERVYAKVSQAKIEREMSNLPEAVKQMMGV